MVEMGEKRRRGALDRFMRGPVNEFDGGRAPIPVAEAAPQEQEQAYVPADEAAYRDFANGRKRIVIMLTEDGARLEPVKGFGGIAYPDVARIIRQVSNAMEDDILAAFLGLAKENGDLRENIAFLEARVPPPPGGPVAVPLMQTGQAGD